ncbi:MAG TPA: hypothetical protein VE779_07795 [Candidatus Angelobacter sp.]|nr:hypothetical protein [Candidatus Angelobacter sp.]
MKVQRTLLSLALAGAVFVAMPARAFQAPAEPKAAPAAKEVKWQGNVQRVDTDRSMITIKGGVPPSSDLRQVAYDSSTVWTKVGAPLEQHSDVKQGSFVILLGTLDNKGILHATRIDLRAEKPSR